MLRCGLRQDQPFFLSGADKKDFYLDSARAPVLQPDVHIPAALMKKTPAVTALIVATFIPLSHRGKKISDFRVSVLFAASVNVHVAGLAATVCKDSENRSFFFADEL